MALRAQDVSSAPEGEYLATPAGPRREASVEPEFSVVSVRGRPYLLPTLAPLASSGGSGRRRQPRGAAASELDLHRTSATVVAELHDPDAIECVREPPSATPNGSAPASEEIKVPSAFIGFLLGKGGKTKERLEQETGATIVVPRGGGTEVSVRLTAPSESALESAVTRVSLLLSEARERAPPTHFVSLPLRGTATQERVRTFTAEALDQHGDATGGPLSADVLVPPERLHATLCMLKLHSPAEVARAKEVLRKSKVELAGALSAAPPLVLRGLEYMNDDPSAVDVLYARCEAGEAHDALQAAWQLLTARLAEAELLPADDVRADLAGKLKVHATLVNTRWRKGAGARLALDARGLLASHGEFEFGAEPMEELHLSRLAAPFDRASGYYHCELRVPVR